MWERIRHMPSRQVMFSALAGGLALTALGFVVYASLFLAHRVGESFSSEVPPVLAPPVRFDIDGFERLRLNQQ